MYLVLTEKPSQANEIKNHMQNVKKEGRAFIGKFYGNDICVIPLAGHILEIPTDLSEHSNVFDEKNWQTGFEKLPYYPDSNSFYKRIVSSKHRKTYNEVKKWIAKCDKIIIATDPDIEGAALAYEVLMLNRALDKVIDYINMDNIVLVEKFLKDAIDGKKNKNLNFKSMAYQGMIRADFNYGIGINISRYIMVVTNSKSTFGTQQTRLLNEIAKRTIDYFNFKQKKYYIITLQTKYGNFTIELKNEDDKFDKQKIIDIATKINAIKNLKIESITRKEKEEKSLPWFDGSDVAQEASSAIGVSPLKLLDEKNGLLEELYLKKIMTYPRGEAKGKMPLSQLADQQNIANAFKTLVKGGEKIDTSLIKKSLWYEDGKLKVNHTPYTIAKTDINIKSLSKDEKIVFDIVLKRLLSVFMPNPVNLQTKITADIGEFKAVLNEVSDIKRGWREIYNMPVRECKTKDAQKGENIKIDKISLQENITKPQPLYTEKSIISFMKRKKIGTQATYAALIQTISSDKKPYIKKQKQKLIATEYAGHFINIVPKNVINILDEFEEEIINKLDNNEISLNEAREKRNILIKKAFNLIKEKFSDKEVLENIQNKLNTVKSDKNSNTVIGKCPKCQKNVINKPKSKMYTCEGLKWQKNGDKWENTGDCDFSIPKIIETEKIKTIITKKNVKDLLEKSKTKIEILFKKTNKTQKKDAILKDNKFEILF